MVVFEHPHDVNKKYYIKTVSYECKNCGNKFIHELPLDDLVKLVEVEGNDVKWLPTFGIGGYLDLINKLAPELAPQFNGRSKAISMKVANIMSIELPKYTDKGPQGNGYHVGGYKQICPKCNSSNNLFEINETIIENPKISWIRISNDLMK